MGIFTSGDTQGQNIAKDINATKVGTGQQTPNGYKTDVEDVYADDMVKQGVETFPVFKVSPEEYFSNQSSKRQRIRFKSDSNAAKYMRKTRNSARPFWIKTTDSKGREFIRRLK